MSRLHSFDCDCGTCRPRSHRLVRTAAMALVAVPLGIWLLILFVLALTRGKK